MSLPQFDLQGSLLESLGAMPPELFDDNDKYKLFAKKVWPVLAAGLRGVQSAGSRNFVRDKTAPIGS